MLELERIMPKDKEFPTTISTFAIETGPLQDDGVQTLRLIIDGERYALTQGEFSKAISHLGTHVQVQPLGRT